MNISVFQDDHLEKKSIRQTPFLGDFGLYIHPLKDRLPQTSVEGCPEDLFIWPTLSRNLKKYKCPEIFDIEFLFCLSSLNNLKNTYNI